jgi:uncharacterized protein (DUF1330 family)
MPAYAVARIKWQDAQGPERYLKLVQHTMDSFGGKYLAFGPVMPVEGTDAPTHLAIVEFPSLDAAKRFYESADYGLAKKIRAISAKTDWLVWIDGLSKTATE